MVAFTGLGLIGALVAGFEISAATFGDGALGI